uniref:Uncharacterized protein n=1 Tax=Cacopsylla melanoneura TaxID=428564 RepID=A0A8D8VD97_9HEMI
MFSLKIHFSLEIFPIMHFGQIYTFWSNLYFVLRDSGIPGPALREYVKQSYRYLKVHKHYPMLTHFYNNSIQCVFFNIIFSHGLTFISKSCTPAMCYVPTLGPFFTDLTYLTGCNRLVVST